MSGFYTNAIIGIFVNVITFSKIKLKSKLFRILKQNIVQDTHNNESNEHPTACKKCKITIVIEIFQSASIT